MDTNKLANELAEIVKSSKDFALAQAPDVVQQMLYYNKIETIFGIGLGLVLLIVTIVLIYYAIEDSEMAYGAISFATGFIGIAVTICNSLTLFCMIYTPKYYLLQQLKSLIHQ